MREFRIPAQNYGRFEKDMNRLAKRADKLGVGTISFDVRDTEEVEVWGRDPLLIPVEGDFTMEQPVGSDAPEGLVYRGVRKYFLVTISGQRPILEGWEFAATIQHVSEAGNILRIVPTVTAEIPLRYRSSEPLCDHCKLIRNRKDTYLVRNILTGEFKQVGSACLMDFTGHKSPDAVADYAELLIRADEYGWDAANDEGWAGQGGYEYMLGLRQVLATTAAVIRQDGWVPKSKADEWGKTATAETVKEILTGKLRDNDYITTDDDLEEAENAMLWAETIDPHTGSDYLWNVRVVGSKPVITLRELGIAASIVMARRRDIEKAERKEREAAEKKHVGTVGQRAEFTVTMVFETAIDGFYGTTYLYKFLDEQGNDLIWFASRPQDFEQGATYRIAAFVKEHDFREGVPQTKVNRVKVLRTLASA